MPHAVFKKTDESLGNILRHARRVAGLELEQVSADTSISVRNLWCLERNQLDGIPEEVYRLHTLKTYSQYLGVNWRKIAPLYEALSKKQPIVKAATPAAATISKKHFWDSVNIVRNSILATLAVGGVGTLCLMAYGATLPPKLIVQSPGDNIISKEEKIIVQGRAPGAAALKINGESIALDANGNFNQDVTLQAGVNIIAISAQKKYSRETIEYRKVLLQSAPVANNTLPAGTPNNEN